MIIQCFWRCIPANEEINNSKTLGTFSELKLFCTGLWRLDGWMDQANERMNEASSSKESINKKLIEQQGFDVDVGVIRNWISPIYPMHSVNLNRPNDLMLELQSSLPSIQSGTSFFTKAVQGENRFANKRHFNLSLKFITYQEGRCQEF